MADIENGLEKEIRGLIASITKRPDDCGFEVFVITKSVPSLKRIGFNEADENNLRKKIKGVILKTLSEKFGVENVEYISADQIADGQSRFYVIKIDEKYDPLAVLREEPKPFNNNDICDASGIAFAIRMENKQLWAYQHLWSVMVPNKAKKNLLAKLISKTTDVFEEIKDPIITITEKVDLLIIDNCIIASDCKLLQNYFGFQDYIHNCVNRTIQAVQDKGIVSDVTLLQNYISRENGKLKYAKKMMRIADSKVLKMDSEKLWNNIHNSKRWNKKIKEENNQFVLKTYTDVENLIDLLDERYTRSDITDVEYDTDVKQVAKSSDIL